MPHFKDRLTTRKKTRKLETVIRPSGSRGGLGGMVNTGAGPDGVVQPDRVAFMTPKGPIHEDELMVQGANGISVIPSPKSPQGFGMPRTQEEQIQMGENAQMMGLKGFQFGGQIPESALANFSSGTRNLAGNQATAQNARLAPQTTTPQASTQATSFQRPPASALADFSSGTQNLISNQLYEQNARNMPGGSQTMTAQGDITPQTPTFSPTLNTGRNQGALGQQTTFQPTIQFPTETKTVQGEAAQTGAQQPIIRPPEQATPLQAPVSPTITGLGGKPVEPQVAKPTSAEDRARAQALSGLSATAAGRSPVDRTIANQALGQLGAEQAEQAGMFRQQAGQMGIEGGRLASGMAQLRQQQGLERAQLGGDLAIAAQNRAADAITQLASQSLAGQQFELTKQQVGNDEAWRQYEAALGASDFGTAAAKYEEMTGQKLNTQQLEQARDYWNQKQEQEIKRDDVIIKDLEQRLGLDKVEAARGMIASGFSIDDVNAQTGMNLSQGEYDTIRDASPLGERDWGRLDNLANGLLQEGAVSAAVGVFNQIYPSAGVDWSEVVNDGNAANFGEVQGEIANQLAATNGDWESIPQAIKDNWETSTGLSQNELQAWFQGMNVNQIDAQWQTIEDSNWYKGLDSGKQGDLQELFTAVTSGELEFQVVEEFTVTRPDGTKKTFTNEGAAASYAANNNGTVESTGSRVMFRDLLTGEVADGTGDGGIATPSGKVAGDTFVSGGQIYRSTGEGNPPEPISVDINDPNFDPFGKTADDVIEAGDPKNNPYYNDIQDMRKDLINKIESNPKLIVNQIVTEGTTLYDKVKSMATNIKPDVTTKEAPVKKVKGAGNDYQYVEGFDDGNKIIFWDGELYYVDPRVNIDKVGVDESQYTLTKLSDGTITTIGI